MDPTIEKSPLLQDVIKQIRVRHYSRRTEETYLHWIKRYIYFHKKRHPDEIINGDCPGTSSKKSQ
jgi:hypothetical protein